MLYVGQGYIFTLHKYLLYKLIFLNCVKHEYEAFFPVDLTAAMAMLDGQHPSLSQHSSDNNSYVLGRIANHNEVVLGLAVFYFRSFRINGIALARMIYNL